MKKDFTILVYIELLKELKEANYAFQSFNEFLEKPKDKSIVLRHDVDLLPANSLSFAKIQADYGIKGTYYFRAVPESWDENIIKEISNLGHEIGYHYENLTTCSGNFELGILDFEKNLDNLRKLAPVSTICMHGSPMSKYDSKQLWEKYDYRNYGIIGEPYFDVDFNKVLYLTDTGRMWDGNKVSVRDKVDTIFEHIFHSTDEILSAIKENEIPNKVMFTFHPQRWHESNSLWIKELLLQSTKNMVKKYFFVSK